MDRSDTCKISLSYYIQDNGTFELFSLRCSPIDNKNHPECIFVSWTPETGYHSYVTQLWQDGIFDISNIHKISNHCSLEESWIQDQVMMLATLLHKRYGIDNESN